ncbi:trypsin-like peptidase domain-containing protein [Pontibacter harenae]|uniref:trypsin-like peptidase domain-containing protein n=1 Tax=Pontibacter harenae TaxID=2894083 RepID=UPI001E2D5095|nr:trypsin-like peptidase domain-containing protein [Pontibacter harenae]MCC9168512.1 trypsin-like peptidase domain-containing protein [Pontibacter harenae]
MEFTMYEQIERYLSGAMPPEERIAFEALLLTDPRLAVRVQEHKQLLDALQKHGQRTALKNKLSAIHTNMEVETETAPVSGAPSPFLAFWKRHSQTMAVAASVSLLSVFGTLWSVQQLKTPVQQQTARYIELRREVEKIKKAHTALLNNINEGAKPVPRAARFIGTGFAISADGYIVTSSHVIEGADSLIIENKAGLKYKVSQVYSDQNHDLAILKIEDPAFEGFGKLPYTFKTTESDLGEKVFTLGYPREDIVFGEGSLSSSTGFEGDSTAYQISIPLNPGNSGGPLLDDKGNLIGVISGKQAGQEGAAFAVKSDYLLHMISELPEKAALSPITLPKSNMLTGNSRTQQLKKLKEYVFIVKVYN